MSNRKGISTILGTLIFIGILFSAVAPMLLQMRQADAFYEIYKQELRLEESNREQESLLVYGYGEAYSTNVYVTIQNRGPTQAIIKRIWYNDEYIPVFDSEDPDLRDHSVLNPLQTAVIGPYDCPDSGLGKKVALKVTTGSGNIFPSELGKLSWDGSHNGWYTPSLGISIHILNDKGKYQIIVYNQTDDKIYDYESIDIEWDDIDRTILIGDDDPACLVIVNKLSGKQWIPLYYDYVMVPQDDYYIVHVIVDGR